MNIALVAAFLFYIGSTFGWLLELIYRRFVSTKKWINPGFLTGPYLPIYGISLCLLFAISFVDMSWIENPTLQNIAIIIFMGIIITLLEYVAGIVFIKQMKVKLWDYSDRWGNIQGIICPLYTFFWCILGGIYYFLIQPHVVDAVIWLSNNLAFSFVIGFFFGIITIDTVNSFNLVVKVKEFAQENEMLVRFEELKAHIRDEQLKRKEKIHFMFAFKTTEKLTDILSEYKEKYQARFQNKK